MLPLLLGERLAYSYTVLVVVVVVTWARRRVGVLHAAISVKRPRIGEREIFFFRTVLDGGDRIVTAVGSVQGGVVPGSRKSPFALCWATLKCLGVLERV